MAQTDGDREVDRKTEWAEARTDWAEDRTLLANERTFAGWMRTGMAALAVAIGLKAVFGDFDPTWLAKAVASIFIVIAVLIFAAAAHEARKAQSRITSHDAEAQGARRMLILALLLSLGAIATGAILWLL
ncbi:putative membrane protein [Limimaricola soesokkakensis]|uniref:Putative membrane protein n=1 Tax=Limimaricola soesokkakensis TaxID=1343159 RepID=A0A1X6Z7G3_9RHOB|nr:DUF202 domain-containing protein [Limimaricola soesokkakensis]PSK86675.1 putative membrane protein [Limimaricola soesokkakensis]SLN42606.1 hypothetical protein LOS8367_01847 [Limimaricola soesokkakensis]